MVCVCARGVMDALPSVFTGRRGAAGARAWEA